MSSLEVTRDSRVDRKIGMITMVGSMRSSMVLRVRWKSLESSSWSFLSSGSIIPSSCFLYSKIEMLSSFR